MEQDGDFDRMKFFKIEYQFEKCNHEYYAPKTLCGIYYWLKHLKDFHQKDFNHACDVNEVWGEKRVSLSYELDKLENKIVND